MEEFTLISINFDRCRDKHHNNKLKRVKLLRDWVTYVNIYPNNKQIFLCDVFDDNEDYDFYLLTIGINQNVIDNSLFFDVGKIYYGEGKINFINQIKEFISDEVLFVGDIEATLYPSILEQLNIPYSYNPNLVFNN